ncbi:MAG: sialidase family protein [Halieaceae bacterium]|jgi:hypothetical protein|nr:sialidase family protein [Halieaceae bacterium]
MRTTHLLLALALLTAGHSFDALSQETLILKGVVHFEDFQNREPALLELANGDLLVAGFPRYPHEPARAPSLWRSRDGGAAWARVNVGTPSNGAIGNSDVDLAVAPDGTVYFVTMGYNRTTDEGTHISIGVSKDHGESWTWTLLTDRTLSDRPWVEVAPDGTAHVIWNDDQGVYHAVSKDAGASWQELPKVHPVGGSSHLAVGPAGEVAVRVTPIYASGNEFDPAIDLVAVSTDGGQTWKKHTAPGSRDWVPYGEEGLPRWVEPLAWDADGALYYLWSEGRGMHLGKSSDLGASWESWEIATDKDMVFFPFMAASGAKELSATWFSAEGGMGVRVARIGVAADKPEVMLSELLRFDSWSQTEDGLRRDTNGEYAPLLRLKSGQFAVVTPLQDPREDRLGFSFWRLSPGEN